MFWANSTLNILCLLSICRFLGGVVLKLFNHTVDGRNPAPPGMYKTLDIYGYFLSQLVQDFFHQPYVTVYSTKSLRTSSFDQFVCSETRQSQSSVPTSIARKKIPPSSSTHCLTVSATNWWYFLGGQYIFWVGASNPRSSMIRDRGWWETPGFGLESHLNTLGCSSPSR